jgi:putative hydrolase of the HAD superfamily
LFDEIIIDALDAEDCRRGKQNIFKTLLDQHGWQPREVCVVGDNPNSELKAAKELGMIAVQVLRPSVVRAAGMDRHVQDLYELTRILKQSTITTRSNLERE